MAYIPTDPHLYQGKQVIINSDRLVFNAKDDSILLYSDKAIGFNTKGNVHFDLGVNLDEVKEGDTQNKFVVNSPNIYLGLEYDNTLPQQSAVLADDLITALKDILYFIETIYADIAFQVSYLSTTEGTLTGMNRANSSLLRKRRREIYKVIENLEDIKSKNTKLV